MKPRAVGWPALVLGVLAALVLLQSLARQIPPLQSPDEPSHLVRVVSLVDGFWLPETQEGEGTGVRFDFGFAYMARAFAPLITQADPPVPQAFRDEARTQGWMRQHLFTSVPGSTMYLPVIYFPAALGVGLGKALDATALQSYHLGRLSSQLFCVLVVALAAWLWRPPLLALALLLLPMSLFQMASPVIDGPSHALTMLVMALYLRLRQEGGALSPGWALLWCASLVALVTARLHLAPLLLLPFVLAWALRSRAWAWAGVGCGVVSAAWVLLVLRTVVDPRVKRSLSTTEVALHYLRHPQELFGAFERTFSDEARLRFLGEGFLGTLGWLDVRLSPQAYSLLSLGLTALMVLGALALWRGRAAWGERGLLLGLGLVSALLAFLLMLLTWSPFPTTLIEGVQGRYLLAPALVAAHAWAVMPGGTQPGWGEEDGWRGRLLRAAPLLVLLAFAGVGVSATSEALQARYPAWALSSLWP